MKPIFHASLVNDPFYDPVLFIKFLYQSRAILFDLGDISKLSARDMLKITHVFVTHTHMDHFIGFDLLLRIFLGRNKKLCLFGPTGFLKNVEGKLAGYTWNLVYNYITDFKIIANEIREDSIIRKEYICRKRFASDQERRCPFYSVLLKEPGFSVSTTILEHNQIPCLAFSIKENFHININKEKLEKLGLPVGPWLSKFKEAIYKNKDADMDFTVTWEEKGKIVKEEKFSFQKLIKEIAIITPGQKITYVTDVSGSRENIEKIIEFAQDSDILFIEATFLERDKELAKKKAHLTAKQAGMIARLANAKKFVIFHFSPRYHENPDELQKEAMAEFSKIYNYPHNCG